MLPLKPTEPDMDLNHAYSQQQLLLIRDSRPEGRSFAASTVSAFDAFASSIRTFQQARGAELGFGRVARIPHAILGERG